MRTLRTLVFLPILLASVPPARATVADDLCPTAQDPCVVNKTITLTPSSVIDLAGRALQLGAAARITIGAGDVQILAGPVRVLAGARITGSAGAAASTLEINATGSIALEASGSNKSRIDVSGDFTGGSITLNAGGPITVAGDIVSDGRDNEASGGAITLESTSGDILISGALSATGGSDADGGVILVTAQGGKIDVAQQVDLSGGDFGGGELDLQASGDVIVRQDIHAGGGGFSGDGGALSIDAGGSATMLGTFEGEAAGDSEEGGGTGGDVEINADGDVQVSGQMQLTGGFPDGEGGTFFVQAGGSFTHTAAIQMLGNGIDGCGGEMDVSAGRDISLDRIDVSGGSCGAGDVTIEGLGTVTVGNIISADGTTGISTAGFIGIKGRDVLTNAVVRATGGSQSPGGLITLEGCTVTVAQASEIRSPGGFGNVGFGNVIRVGGKATVRGKLVTTSPSTNVISYRDPATPPTISGSISPAAVVSVDPTLPPCPGETAACGDGALDPGEQCDDGNVVSCDGCSASCRQEGCGNSRVECDEECDAGPLNGAPGSGCDAQCKVVALPGGLLLLPGGTTRNSCMAEWQIKNPNGPVNNGFPSRAQPCIDGDPSCDQDGATDGKCVFQTAVCAHVTDARIPSCDPIQVESISINKPNVLSPADVVDAANGTALKNVLAALGLTVKAGTNVLAPGVPDLLHDHCSATTGITVPHPAGLPGSRELNIAARDGLGGRMRSNDVTLVCQPNTALCGNNKVEIGEQCDDGNQVACDGCAPTCRVERCGDGIVECSEQCDDGPANGTPASHCTSTCTEVVPALRIPGGGSKRTDCLLETSIDMQNPELKGDGTPSNKQVCVDNDPTCDFDPNPGSCEFHVWLCLGAADSRLACAADSVASIEVKKPSTKDQGAAAVLRQALLDRFGAFTLPLPAGERCTKRVDVEVNGRKDAKLSLKIRNPAGDKDSDSLKLKCEPPPG